MPTDEGIAREDRGVIDDIVRASGALASSDAAHGEEEGVRRELERLRLLTSDRGVLEAVFRHSPHGILVCDPRGKIVLQNAAAERIWAGSASADTIEEWGRYRAFHPDGRPYEPGDWSMTRCLTQHQTIDAEEVLIQRFDGSYGVLLGSCAPIYGPDGALDGALSVFADITRLRDTHERLATITDSLPVLVSYVDASGHYRFANLAYERWFGRHRANIVGEHLRDVLGEAALAHLQPYLDAVLRGETLTFQTRVPYADGGERFIDATYIPHFGRDRVVQGFVALVTDASERKQFEESRAESAQRTERLLNITAMLADAVTPSDVIAAVVDGAASAFDASSAGLWLLDDGRTTATLVRSIGYAPAAASKLARIPLESQPPIPALDVLKSGQPLWFASQAELLERYPHLAPLVTPGREYTIACLPIQIEGRTIGTLALTFDDAPPLAHEDRALLLVAARHCAQALERVRLFHQEQEARAAAEAAFDAERAAREAAEAAQAETELLYRLTDAVNRADSLEQVYETSLDAIRRALAINRASILLFDDDDVMRFKAWRGLSDAYRAAVEGHSPWTRDTRDPQPIFVPDVLADAGLAGYRPVFEAEGIRALGFVPLLYDGRLLGKFMLYSAEPRGFAPREIRIAQSIADQVASAAGRKIAQHDRERLIARLSEMLRENEALATEADAANRTKDEFFAMLGHELRNPLSPIFTALQVMRLRGLQSREQEIIERQVAHLTRLVDDLLDVSRITRGKIDLRKERVEIGHVVVRALEMASPLLEQRQHQIDIRIPRRGLGVDVDCDRMAQVVSNVLTNAAKYSDQGSKILVRAEKEGGVVRLSVKDEGIGIAPEMIGRIFDLFVQQPQTLDRARGGLGLGLAIVRSLVQMHGGTVEARSEGLGRGSELVIELPHVELPTVPPADPALASAARARQRVRIRGAKRILIVDDNDDLAATLADALEELGYDVDVAMDGPAALEMAAAFRPDVAIVDIGLPVMDGYELARRLREAQDPARALRLVAITGYGQEEDRRRSEEAGFAMHLVKPVNIDLLSRAIEG